jgi:hypothetical protein
MSDNKAYNGWSNYETWVVKLWMDNSEGDYNYWQEQTEETIKASFDAENDTWKDEAINNLENQLSDFHDSAKDELLGAYAGGACNVFHDLLNAAMSEVDWREIAESMIEDYLADHEDELKESA